MTDCVPREMSQAGGANMTAAAGLVAGFPVWREARHQAATTLLNVESYSSAVRPADLAAGILWNKVTVLKTSNAVRVCLTLQSQHLCNTVQNIADLDHFYAYK